MNEGRVKNEDIKIFSLSSFVPLPSSLTVLIKSLVRETGFDVVGFTPLKSLHEGERAVEQWVSEGRHGTMKYLEDFRVRRERLFCEIPDAKSVICLGVNYFNGDRLQLAAAKGPGPIKGRVARYAWGKDYHQVIREKHEILIRRLKEIAGVRLKPAPVFKSCVDTHAVPERFAAVQAGFGFIGKHTGILNQKFGPWLFLSEIMTDLDLEPDVVPGTGGCGTCQKCQDVCPTGALDENYRLDARRCIAYLTIEYKGVIARELRPKIKDWIFGCDECLAVCPFTSKQKETSWPEFKAGAGPWIDFDGLFNLPSNRAYEKKFEGTPVRRANLKQMLRNACIVLGNSKNPVAIPYLEKALRHESPLVRLHAAWGLGQCGTDERVGRILEGHRAGERDPEVLEEIDAALKLQKEVLYENQG